jgi:hypothetical protein
MEVVQDDMNAVESKMLPPCELLSIVMQKYLHFDI